MELIKRLDDWFDSRLINIDCSADAKAYVVGVLKKYSSSNDDMSRSSIVISFSNARSSGRLEDYQRIGDWILFVGSIHPSSIEDCKDIVYDIGSQSYFSCHKIMMNRWPVYEELSQKIRTISREVGSRVVQRL